jgi:hypothetical protein
MSNFTASTPLTTPTQPDIDLEIEILGAMLVDPDHGYERISDQITAEMFAIEQHRLIFEAIAQTPSPHDLISVLTTLQKSKKLKRAGGQKALSRLMQIVGTYNLEGHAALLLEAHQRREAARITSQIEEAIAEGNLSRAAALGESLSDVGIAGIAPGGELIGEIDRLIARGFSGAKLKAAITSLAGRYRQTVRDIEAIVSERITEADRDDDRADTKAEIERIQAARKQSLDLFQIFPKPLAQAINHVAGTLDLRPECYAMTLLATVSTLHKNGSELRLLESTDYSVTPGLYAGIVAPPSQRKTPIVRAVATKPLQRLHKSAKEQHEARLEDWRQRCKLAKENGDELPPEPAQRLYSFTSTTGEAIMRQAGRQPENGMLYLCDELKALFGSANAYRGGKGSDMEDLLRYYDGDGGKVLRAEGLRDDVATFNFGIVGAIQPEVLRGLLGDGSDANGQWARFVFVEQPVVANVITSDTGSVDMTGLLESAYRKIDSLPEMEYTLSPDAKRRWLEKRNEYELRRCAESRPAMSAYLGKSDGRIGKFAMNLHAVRFALTSAPITTEIPLETIEAAIALTDFSIAQIESIYSELRPDDGTVAPHLAKILDNLDRCGELKPRDVYAGFGRRFPFDRNLKKAAQIRIWFEELESMGLAIVQSSGRSIKLAKISNDVSDDKMMSPTVITEMPDIYTSQPNDDNDDNDDTFPESLSVPSQTGNLEKSVINVINSAEPLHSMKKNDDSAVITPVIISVPVINPGSGVNHWDL